MKISNNYIYVGLFLTDRSKKKVKELINSMPKYEELFNNANKVFIKHCTLLHRNQEKDNRQVFESLSKLYLPKPLDGKYKIAMVATHIGYLDGKVMAIKVKHNMPCANKIPHITICTFGDGKPFDSNKITEWHKLDKGLFIEGEFKVIEKSIKNK